MSPYHEAGLERRTTTYPSNNQLIAHAAMASVGFMILLPIGALVARYRVAKPLSTVWVRIHYGCQLFAALFIIPGFGLGVNFAKRVEDFGLQTNTKHKNIGITLFILYLVQVLVGIVIHWFKRPLHGGHRPPQNYFHAVLGLTIIGLGLYQVHYGYRTMWPDWGIGMVPAGVNRAWMAVAIILIVPYILGLGLLPMQYKNEAEARRKA
ncbi:hypothetical protein DL93DRAFT_2162545 [Clavulina sp. PMI_390]|nr:hypothetical protein DL93DRAFT_2162545 [Clavulina sp. PMI_390]